MLKSGVIAAGAPMDERGLTAFVVTLHAPAATLAFLVGGVLAVLALVVARRRPWPTKAWIALLWWVGVAVVTYSGLTRLLDVRAFDAEKITILP